ncbi:MAG TPA: pseudouridine synthase [Clostridia bacterium]|nr:pseudouridine synthase [Clostridia bacterium]
MKERLQKVMARAGVASRRKCEDLISSGRVSVNGNLVEELGTKVNPDRDIIRVDGKNINIDREKVYIILNKPRGVVTTVHDPRGRKKVTDLVDTAGVRVFPVGRLDMDTEGLLLLTNDGGIAHRLTHPKFEVEKTYHVKVEGIPQERDLAKLRRGISLEDGPTTPAKVRVLRIGKSNVLVRITIREGRKRQVRRMFEYIGHKVIGLKRVGFGPLNLGGLKSGSCRALTNRELKSVKNEVFGRN